MSIIDKSEVQKCLKEAVIRATKGCIAARCGSVSIECKQEDVASCEACKILGPRTPAVQTFNLNGVKPEMNIVADALRAGPPTY